MCNWNFFKKNRKEKTSSLAFVYKVKEEVFQYCFSVKLIDTKTFKRLRLLSITKLQNLKAIHNIFSLHIYPELVVINHKTTKFESNSQPHWWIRGTSSCCYQSQHYKIWKQFTTCCMLRCVLILLLSITKLQNLKAIHNQPQILYQLLIVVINHKTTKFESNSQQIGQF